MASVVVVLAIFTVYLSIAQAWLPSSRFHSIASRPQTSLFEVPMELIGQLDPNQKWTVRLIYKGQEKEEVISEDTSVLEAAEKIWRDAPSSCRNGVCTTCAGQVYMYAC